MNSDDIVQRLADILQRLERCKPYGDDATALIDAAAEIMRLQQQVSLWKHAAEAFEMGFFDTGNLFIDRARGGSDFIGEARRG